MKRKIITIDNQLCNGCGICVDACHEGAIAMVDGKAKLIRDDYCDGLGDCLPTCPTNAITFEEREALEYDEAAVKANMAKKKAAKSGTQHSGCPSATINTFDRGGDEKNSSLPCGCPSTAAKTFDRSHSEDNINLPCGCPSTVAKTFDRNHSDPVAAPSPQHYQGSELRQFPIQIQLVPANAPYFQRSDLLIAADCTAFAYGAFHQDLIKGKITIIGCPKLDSSYTDKFTDIFTINDIKSVTIARMEVPCCGGIVEMVKTAMRNSGKMIPWQIVTISRDGKIVK